MRGGSVTLGGSALARSVALLVSSVTVLAVAVGFDVVADEPPVHTLTVALAAAIVGLGRFWLRGRLRGVFAAVNVAVIGQPAVHALTKLAHAGADALPHSHALPEELYAVSLHLVIALLVVAVAASEPLAAFVATTVLCALVLLTRAPRPVGPAAVLTGRRTDQNGPPRRQLLRSYSLSRRGPPVALAHAS
jgi:hypothetical protein